MKLEVNISKGNMFVLIAVFVVIGGIFFIHAGVSKSSPWHSASQIETSSGKSVQEEIDTIKSLQTFSAGNVIVATSNAVETSTNRGGYTTLKTFAVGQAGTIRLEFQYRTTHEDFKVTPRVIRGDGTVVYAPGSYQRNDNWQSTGPIDITVSAGERIHMQARANEYACYGDFCYGEGQIKNAKIELSSGIPQIVFTD
jgi:hypothetical protein